MRNKSDSKEQHFAKTKIWFQEQDMKVKKILFLETNFGFNMMIFYGINFSLYFFKFVGKSGFLEHVLLSPFSIFSFSKSLELKSKVVLLFSHGVILVFLLLTSNIHQKNCKTVARLSITHTSFKSFNGIQNGVKKTLM